SVAHGRLCIVLAAVLWSTNGVFIKVLSQDTPLGLNKPRLDPLQLASLRMLCAGTVLLPLLRRRDITFRPMMLATAICFALMNATFITAIVLGTAANAVFLQYTAPMWVYLFSVWCLGKPADRRAALSVAIGVVGILVLVYGGWKGG